MTEDDDDDKGPFELMREAQEEWRKQPRLEVSAPSKPFDPRAFDEAYAKLVPPRRCRPASEFAGEVDPEARADALHDAYLVGEVDLKCSEIRALIAGVLGTHCGHLLDELVNPKPKALKPRSIRRRKPKHQHPKLPDLIALAAEAEADDENN